MNGWCREPVDIVSQISCKINARGMSGPEAIKNRLNDGQRRYWLIRNNRNISEIEGTKVIRTKCLSSDGRSNAARKDCRKGFNMEEAFIK